MQVLKAKEQVYTVLELQMESQSPCPTSRRESSLATEHVNPVHCQSGRHRRALRPQPLKLTPLRNGRRRRLHLGEQVYQFVG
jgi:hypothetical protein